MSPYIDMDSFLQRGDCGIQCNWMATLIDYILIPLDLWTVVHAFASCIDMMGAVRITSLNPKFNGSHFGLPPSSIHRMTGWVAFYRILWRMRTAPIPSDPDVSKCNQSRWPFNCPCFHDHHVMRNSSVKKKKLKSQVWLWRDAFTKCTRFVLSQTRVREATKIELGLHVRWEGKRTNEENISTFSRWIALSPPVRAFQHTRPIKINSNVIMTHHDMMCLMYVYCK